MLLIQLPEVANRQAWGAFVLRKHPQLPAAGALELVEFAFQGGPLLVGEGLGQIDHRRGVIGQQLGVVVGPGTACGDGQEQATEGEQAPGQAQGPPLQQSDRQARHGGGGVGEHSLRCWVPTAWFQDPIPWLMPGARLAGSR
jgi:hypothetical protein